MSNFKVTPDGQGHEQVPPEAKRIHLYPAEEMLAPRGSMEKESLSLELAIKLDSTWRNWTDDKYSDSLSAEAAAYQLLHNLRIEMVIATEDFITGAMNVAQDLPKDFAENCRKALLEHDIDTNIDDTPSD